MGDRQTVLDRIKTRKDFLAANRHAKKAVLPGMVLQARKRREGEKTSAGNGLRVGFTVTKKVGNAVIRNRARRRLRAAAEEILGLHGLPGFDYILIGRQTTLDRPYPALLKDLTKALKRLDAYHE